jgi:hypothetical protein
MLTFMKLTTSRIFCQKENYEYSAGAQQKPPGPGSRKHLRFWYRVDHPNAEEVFRPRLKHHAMQRRDGLSPGSSYNREFEYDPNQEGFLVMASLE